jgi:hypothetical protein
LEIVVEFILTNTVEYVQLRLRLVYVLADLEVIAAAQV